jgi:hypothetical protein
MQEYGHFHCNSSPNPKSGVNNMYLQGCCQQNGVKFNSQKGSLCLKVKANIWVCLFDLQDVQGQSVPIVIELSTQMPDWCLDQTRIAAIRILRNSSFISYRSFNSTDDKKCLQVRQ